MIRRLNVYQYIPDESQLGDFVSITVSFDEESVALNDNGKFTKFPLKDFKELANIIIKEEKND